MDKTFNLPVSIHFVVSNFEISFLHRRFINRSHDFLKIKLPIRNFSRARWWNIRSDMIGQKIPQDILSLNVCDVTYEVMLDLDSTCEVINDINDLWHIIGNLIILFLQMDFLKKY